MNKAFSRARVGFLILIGVITFVVAIFLIGQKSQLFSPTFTVRVNFANTEGVKPGSIVVMNGYAVGAVADIVLSENADSVRVTLRINASIRSFIKADSKAEIKQEGLVGNKLINIIRGSDSLPAITENSFIQGVPPFALGALADNVTAITDSTKLLAGQLHQLLARLNRGEGTVGRLLTDETIYRKLLSMTTDTDSTLSITMHQLNTLASLLTRVTHSVDEVVHKADTSIASTNRITIEIETLMHNLNSGKGSAGALLSDRALYDSLVSLISSLTDVTYDAGNAANQAAQSIYSMRQHWLLGRIFGGDDAADEARPVPAYQRKMKELQRREAALEQRERQVRETEERLGIPKPEGHR